MNFFTAYTLLQQFCDISRIVSFKILQTIMCLQFKASASFPQVTSQATSQTFACGLHREEEGDVEA